MKKPEPFKPISDFIESIRKNGDITPFSEEQLQIDSDNLHLIFKYVNFFTKPIEVGFFVPTSKKGIVLPEPSSHKIVMSFHMSEYREAKSRVLFEGWKLRKRKGIFNHNIVYNDDFEINLDLLKGFFFIEGGGFSFDLKGNTIEHFVNEVKLIPTETALKQSGLWEIREKE